MKGDERILTGEEDGMKIPGLCLPENWQAWLDTVVLYSTALSLFGFFLGLVLTIASCTALVVLWL